MNVKTIFVGFALWTVAVIAAAVIAAHVCAQQLVPPPPVLGLQSADLVQVQVKLEAIERLLQSQHRMVKAMWVRLNPMKLEQGILDLAPN